MRVKLRNPNSDVGFFSRTDYGKAIYDYEKIQEWMTTLDGFLPALKALDAALKQARGTKKRLTDTLASREREFGINLGGVPTYTGILSDQEFVGMNQKVVLPKDHVTPEHGEFTHRLQWYVVLHNMSAGFTKGPKYSGECYNSAVDLLKGTTSKVHKPPQQGWPIISQIPRPDSDGLTNQYEPGAHSMWEALFDRRPHPKVYATADDWISCPEMFTALLLPRRKNEPPTLQAYRALQMVSGQKKMYALWQILPELSFEVETRYNKRSLAVEKAGGLQQWVEMYRIKKAGPHEQSNEERVLVDVPSHEYFKYADKGRSMTVLVRRTP